MTQWHFFDKVYRRWLCLMIGSPEDLIAELKHDDYDELNDIKPQTAKGMCIRLTSENTSTGQNCTIIWMPRWETATLVHELVHLVMFTFDDIGIPMERNNTETMAFYVEYWFNEINRAYRRSPNGVSPKEVRR